jgi:hypothetical protein
MRNSIIFILLIASTLISSCGTTSITLNREVSGAKVYVDGEDHGSLPAKINRTGAPVKKLVRVTDASGNEITSQIIRRKIKAGTVIWGIVFLPAGYVGLAFFVFDWKFDREIILNVPSDYQPKSPWDEPLKKKEQSTKKSSWD